MNEQKNIYFLENFDKLEFVNNVFQGPRITAFKAHDHSTS